MRGKQFFRKKMKYNQQWLNRTCWNAMGTVCHPPDMRIPTITEEKVETLYFDILWTHCLDFFFSLSSVLKEDLPKSVCLVKKVQTNVLSVSTDTFQSTATVLFGTAVFCFAWKTKRKEATWICGHLQVISAASSWGDLPVANSRCKTERHRCNIWDVNTPTEPIHRLKIELVLKCHGGLRL